MRVHKIGLGRAWQLISLDGGECLVQRHFNAPTGIGVDQVIRLHLSCQPGIACQAVALNEILLGSTLAADCRIDLTGQLRLNNTLRLTLGGSQVSNHCAVANARLLDITPFCQVKLEIVGE